MSINPLKTVQLMQSVCVFQNSDGLMLYLSYISNPGTPSRAIFLIWRVERSERKGMLCGSFVNNILVF